MNLERLPRALARYLASLPVALQEILPPLLVKVQEALGQEETSPADVLAILAEAPLATPAQEAALIEALARLPHPLLPQILAARFAASDEKVIQKALKKALHLLKVQRVEIPPELSKPSGTAILSPFQEPPALKAYVSRIEGDGTRLIAVHLPGMGQPFNLIIALVNDQDGFKDLYAVPMSNKEVKSYLEQLQTDATGKLADVDPAYAFSCLEEYFLIAPESTAEGVLTYRQLRSILRDRLEGVSSHDITSLLPPLEDRQSYLNNCVELLTLDDFFSWVPEQEQLLPFVEKLAAMQNSPLHLTEAQQQARYEDLLIAALKELFPQEQRLLIGKRLLHMAYYLLKTDRLYMACLAQAAGEDLLRERSSLEKESPFLVGLFMLAMETLHHALGPDEEQPPTSGQIITNF